MKTVLRWIAVMPVSFLVYGIARIVQDLCTMPWMPGLIEHLNRHGGFGSYMISGPVYVFTSQAVAVAIGMLAAGRFAPAGRERVALWLTAGSWAVLIIVSLVFIDSRPGVAFRTVVEIAGEVFGILAAMRYLRS